ncbi:hypothetical protein [Virgibacillus sp. L01]
MGHVGYDGYYDFNEYQFELEMRKLEEEERRLNRLNYPPLINLTV